MNLRVITNSELKTARACLRLHHYEYRLGYRTAREEESLRFGSAIHAGLEAWWLAQVSGADALASALDAVSACEDDFERAKAEELLVGYDVRWPIGDSSDPTGIAEVLAVERQFSAPLINPATGASSRTFELGGKVDVIVRINDGRTLIVEHKTSTEDIGPGSEYWRRLTLDSQISTYYAGAKRLGFDVQGCLYDVLARPRQRCLLATPVESRKYTKKTGELYKGQRADDETPEDFRVRVREHIADNPDRYYQRGIVVRLEDDERDAAYDTWHMARLIRDAELSERYPRNPDACSRYGRTCAFFDVCTRTASLDDPLRFRRAERTHEELESSNASLDIATAPTIPAAQEEWFV